MASHNCEFCNSELVLPLQLSGCGHLVCSFCLKQKCRHGLKNQQESGCQCPVNGCAEDHSLVYYDRAVEREITIERKIAVVREITVLNEPPRTLLKCGEDEQTQRRETGEVARLPFLSQNIPLEALQRDVEACLNTVQQINDDLCYLVEQHCDIQDMRNLGRRLMEAEKKCRKLYEKTGSIEGIDFGCEPNFTDSSCNIRDVNRQNLMFCNEYGMLQEKVMKLFLLYEQIAVNVGIKIPTYSIKRNWRVEIIQGVQAMILTSQQGANRERQIQATTSLLEFQIDRRELIKSLQNLHDKDQTSIAVHFDEKNKVLIATWCLEKMSFRSSLHPFVIFTSKSFPDDIERNFCISASMEDGVKVWLKCSVQDCHSVRGQISCFFLEEGKRVKYSKDVSLLRNVNLLEKDNIFHLKLEGLTKYFVEDTLILEARLW